MGSLALFYIFPLLVVAFSVCHGALMFQEYWNVMLPNTPMPTEISDHLGEPTVIDRYKSNVGVVSGPDGKPVFLDFATKPIWCYVAKKDGDEVDKKPNVGQELDVGDHSITHGHLDRPEARGFFLEKDLRMGGKMKMALNRGVYGDKFLPRRVATTIPFSTKMLPEILRRFAVQPDTFMAKKLERTVRVCEEPPTGSETNICATSLESMVEFATSTLRTNNLQALKTVIGRDALSQVYTVQSWTTVPIPTSMATACHVHEYPYTVFHCHWVPSMKPYMLKLVGKDGTTVDAAAVCHVDTSDWSPTYHVLRAFKLSPGESTVCHIVQEGDVIWFPHGTAVAAM